jgi:hypothetical protein
MGAGSYQRRSTPIAELGLSTTLVLALRAIHCWFRTKKRAAIGA